MSELQWQARTRWARFRRPGKVHVRYPERTCAPAIDRSPCLAEISHSWLRSSNDPDGLHPIRASLCAICQEPALNLGRIPSMTLDLVISRFCLWPGLKEAETIPCLFFVDRHAHSMWRLACHLNNSTRMTYRFLLPIPRRIDGNCAGSTFQVHWIKQRRPK